MLKVKYIVCSIIFPILEFAIYADAQCAYYQPLVPNGASEYSSNTCSDFLKIDPTNNPNIVFVSATLLTVTFSFEITDFCTAPTDTAIFILNAYDGNSYHRVFEIRALSKTSFQSYVIDKVGKKSFHQISSDESSPWVTGAVAIDLAIGKVAQSWISSKDYSYKILRSQDFKGWSWKAGSNPYMLYFGKDPETDFAVNYNAQGITYKSVYEPYLFPLVLGSLSPSISGCYSMLQGSGSSLTDSIGEIGTAYFGDPQVVDSSELVPGWSAIGVKFSDFNQFITIPSVTMCKQSNPVVTASLTISFMLKFYMTAEGKIFQRLSTLSKSILELNTTSDGKLTSSISGVPLVTSIRSLYPRQWYHVSVFYMYTNGRAASSISINGVLDTTNIETDNLISLESISFEEASTDVFKIGGFKGTIKNLKIFGPGSPKVTETSSCSKTCAMELGAQNTSCLNPLCGSGFFSSGEGCEKCDLSCQTCEGAGPYGCSSCNASSVLSLNNSCIQSPIQPPKEPNQEVSDASGLVIGLMIGALLALCVISGLIGMIISRNKKRRLEKKNTTYISTEASPPSPISPIDASNNENKKLNLKLTLVKVDEPKK